MGSISDQNKSATVPRIAIKFGTPSAAATTATKSKSNPPSTLGKRPRSGAWGDGSDSEGEDDHGRHETITGFGVDGAETERKSKDARTDKKEYVIARQPNRDWKAEMKAHRKGKNLLPEEARAQQNGNAVEVEPADQDKELKWGLAIKEKATRSEDRDEQEPEDEPSEIQDSKPERKSAEPPAGQTADHEALQALLGEKPERTKTIIPSEQDAYQRDLDRAGEASTLADYEAMPVEEFGAALLRGMGWDGKERGSKVKEVKRRPARLGLGAKELKGVEELGGWNQGGKKKHRPRLDEYRREESKRKEGRRHEDSYKRERERERETERDRYRDRPRDRDRGYDRHRDRHCDYDRDRRR